MPECNMRTYEYSAWRFQPTMHYVCPSYVSPFHNSKSSISKSISVLHAGGAKAMHTPITLDCLNY
jgi:hypothetical protein